jgi:diguanylate cyclase (GGDEF)-like protein/PAS domain S-box-containing protein
VVPEWRMVTWAAIGLTGSGAVLLGVRRHRPRRAGLWLLLAASLALLCGGDAAYNVMVQILGMDNPFPSVADALYLAMYPTLAIGLIGFIRSCNGGRDRGSLLDALTVTSGLGLLAWIFLIVPYVRDPDLKVLEKLTSVAYPLGDILILLTITRLLGGVRRNRSVDLLAAGTVGLLIADVLYGLIQLDGTWKVGTPVDLAWVVFYGAFGAAALHPSMVRLTEPSRRPSTEVTNRHVVLLLLPSLVAPVTLLIEAVRGRLYDAPVIAVMSAITFLLVLSRLAGMVASQRQAGARERGLREAAATLMSVTSAPRVIDGLRSAVAQLLPAHAPHRMVILSSDADVAVASGWWGTERSARLLPTSEVDEGSRAELSGFDVVLAAPLFLEERQGGDPHIRVLLVAADEAQLSSLHGAFEVLASQAAQALERIALAAQINQRNSEEYFRTLVHNSSDVILILDADDLIRYASPSIEAMFGVESLSRVAFVDVVHPQWRDAATRMLARVRSGAAPGEVADWSVIHADGSTIQVEVTCRDLRDEATISGVVLTLRDVTERRQLERELTHRAFHDALTGLANRVLFQDRVTHAIGRDRAGGGLVGVLFIDLDDFKVVNDTMGHGAGDELLVAVAHRLAETLRGQDVAARLGGDEFAALIEDVQDPAEFDEIAGRVVQALAEPFTLATRGVTVNGTASVGIATTLDASDAVDLLRQADLALYVAKGAGKSQWCRYQPALHLAMRQRLDLRNALDQAVQDSAFTLFYQPIVELDTGATVGFEALVRWQHPTKGLIPPAQFIEVAEESGLILPIGAWVLEQALRAMTQWRARLAPGPVPYISVNVSVRQFREPGFVDRIRAVLDSTGAPANSVVLEITESLLLRDDEQIWADLSALRQMGIRIAIDDFGTGYSSLSYLRQFPIDVLKIDKSFIDDMLDSPQQRAVVDAIVRLADTLDLLVIAEGIESPAHRELLARMGCPLGQGYLFAWPLPFNEATQWLPAPVGGRAVERQPSVTGLPERTDLAPLR